MYCSLKTLYTFGHRKRLVPQSCGQGTAAGRCALKLPQRTQTIANRQAGSGKSLSGIPPGNFYQYADPRMNLVIHAPPSARNQQAVRPRESNRGFFCRHARTRRTADHPASRIKTGTKGFHRKAFSHSPRAKACMDRMPPVVGQGSPVTTRKTESGNLP